MAEHSIWVLSLSTLALACDPKPASPQAAHAPPVATRMPPVDAGALADPQVALWARELEHLEDSRSTFGALDRKTLTGMGKSKIREHGALPLDRVASVSAYAYAFSANGSDACHVVRPDGQPCDDVVAPGATLSPDQMQRFLQQLREPPAPKPRVDDAGTTHTTGRFVTRCDFDPHHAFVLRDKAGSPLASFEVCFTCGEWQSHPPQADLGGREPAGMFDDERAFFQELCVDLKLGGCFVGDDAKMAAAGALLRAERASRQDAASTAAPAP